MKLDSLVFGTHPDDVELFCAGTLLKLIKQNKKIGIIDLTEGELSTRGNLQIRRAETQRSTEILNISVRENALLEDGNLQNLPENRLRLIFFIRKFKPDIVLLPYGHDRHPDHVNASRLVTDACFYSGLTKIDDGQDAFRPRQLIYYYHHWVQEPTFVVDISDEFEAKISAIKAYQSQFFSPASKEPETFISDKAFLESIENRARYFGDQIGVKYGEPFHLRLPLKINNIFNFFA